MTGQQLKNSILQMAVQGKLVPQDPNDEPASVLLERIRKEKEQLIKEGKIKKEKNPSYIFRSADNLPYEKVGKNEPVCIADEVPFEIPESWEWVRLGNIFQHNTGKALNASNRTGSLLPYITTSNLYWDRFELGNLREMYFSVNEIEKCTATKGDLLVCEGGDIGRAAIWMFDEDIRIQNHIHKLRSYTEVCTEFFYYLFYLYKHAGWIGGKGIGIQGLSANALHALLFPLPPLSEQKRIVSKIKESEPLIEKYADIEKHLDKLNTEFPDQLHKSILQMAVQGKLVPQDPTDEPASVLLERIRAEKEQLIKAGKIKRDKHESIIFRRDKEKWKLPFVRVQQKAFLENVISEADYEYFKSCLKNDDEMFWYFVIRFLAATGARVSELIQIKVEHVKLGHLDLYSKGGKLRRIYIPKELQKEALSWLAEKHQESGFLFLNKYGERITTRGISGQLKKLAVKYGINPVVVYPHSFRHRFAKSFLDRCNDIAFLADLMGHESIETTRIYLRKTATEQREIVDTIVDW